MPRSKIFSTGVPAGAVSFNVVPLVDVAFLMILFFILTSQMSSNEVAALELPNPENSMAQDASKENLPNKIIVNIVSAEADRGKDYARDAGIKGMAKEYMVNGVSIPVGDIDSLTRVFKARKDESEKGLKAGGKKGKDDFCVIVRGDWRICYRDVQPVILAAAKAGIPRMNISAIQESR